MKKCASQNCNEFATNKTDKYCKVCRRVYQNNYRQKIRLRLIEVMKKKPEFIPPVSVKVDEFESAGLPLTWCDKSRKEWSVKYHFDNWKPRYLSNMLVK